METVTDELQMELIDLQNNNDLSNKIHSVNIQKFYQNYLTFQKFLLLVTKAMQIMTFFGSTYMNNYFQQ